jgi:iron complex outermembrane recepter protein
MNQKKLFAAILCAAIPCAYAATDTLEEIVVTASRFSDNALKSPANVIIISAEDLKNSPAMNLPDILKTFSGIDVRPQYGNLGIDATVDMRGFGDTASSNTLILLDGQRLNAIDMGALSWSMIPKNSIQHIEIIPGSGAVLYGDQASGGVINIITDKSGSRKAAVDATFGSYGYKGVDLQGAGGGESGYFNVTTHYAETGGWRQNSRMNQQAISGSTGLYLSSVKPFLDYAIYKDASGLPGNLLSAAYHSDPTASRTPADSQKRNGYHLRPGFSYALSDALDFEAELSTAHEDSHADYVSSAFTVDRIRDTWSITPRLRWRNELGHAKNATVVGMDYYDGQVQANNNGATYTSPAMQNAAQKSSAFYMHNSTEFNDNWTLSAGARNQRMNESASQSAYDAGYGQTPAFSGDSVRSRNAYDLGLVYQVHGWRAYAKAGTTFRFANTDELFSYDPITYNPVFAAELRPQHGTIHEAGASFEQGALRGKATLYQLNLTDEIGYDGASNTNFAPSRRNGLETELNWRLAANLKARFSYTYTDASFRSGIYAGKEIPMVSRDKAAAQLTWQTAAIGTFTVVANYVGDRRYSGDLANAYDKLAGYGTMDLLLSRDIEQWAVSAKLINILDKRYAPNAGYAPWKNDYYYYPADARSLFVNVRYSFR